MINPISRAVCVMLTGLLMLLPSGGIAGNSDFSAGTAFGRSNGNVTKAQMEKAGNNIGEYVPEFDKDKAESEYGGYYGGVKSSGKDMNAPGSTQFNSTEWGQSIQEHKRKAPDMPGVSAGDDFLKQGQKAIDNAQSMFDPNLCKSVSFDKVTTVNKTCERDLEVAQRCTRTATIELKGATTWEYVTQEFEMSQMPTEMSGDRVTATATPTVTGDIVEAYYSWAYPLGTHGHFPMTMHVLGREIAWHNKGSEQNVLFTPSPSTVTAGGPFSSWHPRKLRSGSGTLTFRRHMQLKIRLVIKVKKSSWKPAVVWVENCPFSKAEYELKTSECTEPGATKTVTADGVSWPVTLACWRYEDTYRSQEATEGTCTALKNDSACTRIGVECQDSDGGICYSQKEIWQCQSKSTGKGQVCGDELFCQDGSCVESQAQTNNHFAEAVSALAALAAAGEDAKGDTMDVRVFTGKGQSCRKSGLGFSNCCQSGGWGNDVGLAHCSDEEKALGKAREKGLTIQVGTYCSKKVLGACLQKKTSYCLFDSKLAQIGQEQGRKGQLGIGFGAAKSPDCRGMTVDELSKLRFDNMDFSAFFDELSSKSNVPQDQQLLDRVSNSLKGFSGKFDPDKNQNPTTPIN